MKRCAVLIMLLAISMWAMAQNTQAPQTLVQPGGLSTNTGTAVIFAPPSVPLAVTPELHLSTVNPALGASSATAGNFAGAVNSTAEMPVPPRIITTVPLFSTAGASVVQTLPPQETAGEASAPPSTAAGTGATVFAGAPVLGAGNNAAPFDRGVGPGDMLVTGGSTEGKSLAEIARENRQRESAANARVYTNDDINRINIQPGVTLGGMSGAAIGAGNATQQPPSGGMPVVAQPSTNAPANRGVSRPVPPSDNPPRSEVVPRSPFSPPQARREIAQANPPANPADQNAPAPGNQSRNGQRQLPSAGSILPMMALVGFLAAGAGLLSR